MIGDTCPLDLAGAAMAIEATLLAEGWDVFTAEKSARLATGHVFHQGRWVSVGLNVKARDARLPAYSPVPKRAERDTTPEPFACPVMTAAWGRTWDRLPVARGVEAWSARYSIAERERGYEPALWFQALLAAALAMSDVIALGRLPSHARAEVRVWEPTREVELCVSFDSAALLVAQ